MKIMRSVFRILVTWLLVAGGLILIAKYWPGIHVRNFETALTAGIVMGLINAILKPVLRWLLLPITILTIGLFALILNALLFWLAAGLVAGFEVHGFWDAVVGSLLLSLILLIMERWFP
jgi:putative membrane protein